MEFLNNIYWRNGQPLTSAERNLTIYFLGAGLDNKDIAIALSRGKRTIDKWVNRFEATGEMQAIKHMGRQRATTIQQHLDIALCATENPTIIRVRFGSKFSNYSEKTSRK